MKSVSALGALLVLASIAGSCTPRKIEPCTPETEGYGDDARVSTRIVVEQPTTEGECKGVRFDLVASDEELRRAYDELKIPQPLSGFGVDWSKERAIVRQDGPGPLIQWSVVRGDELIVTLRECFNPNPPAQCKVSILAVPAIVKRATKKTCDPVHCTGGPPPPRQ